VLKLGVSCHGYIETLSLVPLLGRKRGFGYGGATFGGEGLLVEVVVAHVRFFLQVELILFLPLVFDLSIDFDESFETMPLLFRHILSNSEIKSKAV